METCENCRFAWREIEHLFGDEVLACHRYPPQPNRKFPRMQGTDWCGEWQKETGE